MLAGQAVDMAAGIFAAVVGDEVDVAFGVFGDGAHPTNVADEEFLRDDLGAL